MTAVASDPYVVEVGDRSHLEGMVAVEGLGDSTRRLLPHDVDRRDRWIRVARHAMSGRVLGVAIMAVEAGDGHLLDLAVVADHRRRGIGRALVDALRRLAHDELGVTAMTLEVRRSNAAARELYGRLGFTEAGERPDYYPDGGPDGGREPAVIMWDHDLTRTTR